MMGSAKAKPFLVRFVGVSAFLVAVLLSLGFPQCGLVSLCSFLNALDAVSLRTDAAEPNRLNIWIDVLASGVYSPTMQWPSAQGWLPRNDPVDPIPPFLNDLAQKGYIAIRVPHAPPAYAPSSLVPGNAWGANGVEFRYYMPPDAAQATTVPITVTRRAEYEAIVNTRYPITDGRSHWEVWWAEGNRFPIPQGTFRLKEEWPQALELAFQINFGPGALAANCIGCAVDVLVYNGYTFLGPWQRQLVDENGPCPVTNPRLAFDMCGATPSLVQYIDPGVPFTHTHWLGNYEGVQRTYTIASSSSQGWAYTYYYGLPGQPLQRAGSLPFEVTVGAAPGVYPCAACFGIHAVYTPTFTLNDPLRETLTLTATSKVSPTLSSSTVSVALGTGYKLEENPSPAKRYIYLPTLFRSNAGN